MMNGFDPLAARFLVDLDRIQSRSHKAERQISSGLRVETASDSPEEVVEILRLRSGLEANGQVQMNLARVQTRVNTAEKAVQEAVAIMERARVLAAETGTAGALNRAAAAEETSQLHARLLALVSTSASGQFVFGSDGSAVSPYVADATQPNGVRLVAATRTNTVVVSDENQTTFSVDRTASDLFDAPGAANAFQALQDLKNALNSDSEVDVRAAMPKIDASLDHINRQLSFYGHAQNRITNAYDSARKNAISLKTRLGNLQDADLPAAILELNATKLHTETALAAHAKARRSTLFDYLG